MTSLGALNPNPACKICDRKLPPDELTHLDRKWSSTEIIPLGVFCDQCIKIEERIQREQGRNIERRPF